MSNTTAIEEMVRMLVQKCASRKEEIATDRRLYQAEMEQQERQVTKQMKQMQDYVQALMDMTKSKKKVPPTHSSLEVYIALLGEE